MHESTFAACITLPRFAGLLLPLLEYIWCIDYSYVHAICLGRAGGGEEDDEGASLGDFIEDDENEEIKEGENEVEEDEEVAAEGPQEPDLLEALLKGETRELGRAFAFYVWGLVHKLLKIDMPG